MVESGRMGGECGRDGPVPSFGLYDFFSCISEVSLLTLLLAVLDSPEDQTLFEAVYYKYRGQLLGIATGMLNDHHLAEDAVSETMWKTALNFEKLLTHLRAEKGREKLAVEDVVCPRVNGFVVIVLKNICRDMLRKNKHLRVLLCEDEGVLDSLS